MASDVTTAESPTKLETITWGDLTWTNIERPTRKEIDYLAQNYHFNPFDLDDCLSRTQRPKIDEYKDYLFVILHFPVYSKLTRTSTHSQVSVFIGEKFLITLHTGQPKPLVRLFQECQASEEARQENFSHGSAYLLYRIIDSEVDAYFPVLDKILTLIDKIEDKVFDENIETAHELAILRRDIITQRRIIFPMRTVIADMQNRVRRFAKLDMTIYFGDVVDHMNKICETLDECKEIIEVFKDTDFLLSTYRLNHVIRVLTVLSTIILPFLLVSSIYGMNVALPGGMEPGSPQSFLFLLVVMSAIAGFMIYFFRRKRWI